MPYADNFVRFVVTQDPVADLRTYDAAKYAARLKEVSELMDSTNTDLSAFYKRGGKLILRENAGDFAQSPRAGFRYYNDVVKRFGQTTVNSFMRLYVSPGSAHVAGRQGILPPGPWYQPPTTCLAILIVG